MSAAYYAKGMEIWKSPLSTDNGDGTTSISIGFQCATANEIVGEEGAQAIAEMLTLSGSHLASVVEERDRLRKALEESCNVHAGLAEFILKRPNRANRGLTKTEAGGIFADLQRARLAAYAALEAKP